MVPPEQSHFSLEQFRGYLLLLAQLHWNAKLQGLVEPSDLVQQTLLEAHQNKSQFSGTSSAEFAGWLRKSLANNIADEIRKVERKKRDVNLVRSLEAAFDDSSSRLEECLAADESTPRSQAERNEQLTRMADALGHLPEANREAIIGRHLSGLTLKELAKKMDRTEASVAGRRRRGLKELRNLLDAQ
jgi:RNA polymerase sigma-70 factor, ECF subfamily